MKTILSIDDRLTLINAYPHVHRIPMANLIHAGEQLVMPPRGFPDDDEIPMVFRAAVMAFVNWRLSVPGTACFARKQAFDMLRRACREVSNV